ncbi:hypothetical protein EOD42_07720 [Rhodovarius crocodyli]|uniref:Uncharacterized protein n=1 Tax=Rhodovarius crocodyli TaxID=1979269 RepID=A0A437MJ82_9PROT|nr:hypothetical protein [Rhodovarius crocodyli]RVT97691.1 hypothetical protein EOD42_07720 [Rhodovarius crocodyli]
MNKDEGGMSVNLEAAEVILMRGELDRLRSVAPDAPNRCPDHENRILRLQAEIALRTGGGKPIALPIAPGTAQEMAGRKLRKVPAQRGEAGALPRLIAAPGISARR